MFLRKFLVRLGLLSDGCHVDGCLVYLERMEICIELRCLVILLYVSQLVGKIYVAVIDF